MALESKRLKFRLFSKKDKNEIIELLNDEAVTKWAHIPFPYTEKHAEWWIKNGSKVKYQFALEEKNTKKLLGSFKISKSGEIGCWIGRKYWNQGFATEAVEKIKEFGFKEAAIGQKTGNKINFFNLGTDNKWQNLLPIEFRKKINDIFKEDLTKWDYKIND